MVELIGRARRRLDDGLAVDIRGGARTVRTAAAGDRRAAGAGRRPARGGRPRSRALPTRAADGDGVVECPRRRALDRQCDDPLRARLAGRSRRPMPLRAWAADGRAARRPCRRRGAARLPVRRVRRSPSSAGPGVGKSSLLNALAGARRQPRPRSRRPTTASAVAWVPRDGARGARAAARLARRAERRPRARRRGLGPVAILDLPDMDSVGSRAPRAGRGGPAARRRRRLGHRPREVRRRGAPRRASSEPGCRDSPARWSSLNKADRLSPDGGCAHGSSATWRRSSRPA